MSEKTHMALTVSADSHK